MQHEWVFEVLKDLKAFATRNNLPALAARVDEALAVAEVEISDRMEAGGMAKRSPLLGTERPQ